MNLVFFTGTSLYFQEEEARTATMSTSMRNLWSTWDDMSKLWDAWDVRVMILYSLILQITLFILGNRRKYTVKIWIRIILWFAYLIADWIAAAALGKLSRVQAETSSKVLRAVWAPLLLLHLGGPDTITAYALEDNRLWTRHLLGLVFEAVLVIYVLFRSWTRSWLSLVMNSSMFIAGIIKYIERTWSLKLASSGLAEGTIPVFDIDILVEKPEEAITDEQKLVVAYQFFSAFRPDITNYISTRENLSSSGTKLIMRFMDNIQKTGLWNINMDYLLQTLKGLNPADLFEIIEVELGFLFDVLYTKVPITYTKLGFVFRFISVSCSVCAMGVFFTIIRMKPENHYSIVDITITGILLVGAIVVEFYALVKLLSSNWAVLWINSRNCRNRFRCGMFRKLISWLSRQKKQNWSNSMGQFNLLKYCSSYTKKGGSIILRITGIQELLQRHQHTHYEKVPHSLKVKPFGSFSPTTTTTTTSSFIATRGEKTLNDYGLSELKWSTELDFDESIITWHLATDICYHAIGIDDAREESTAETEGRQTGKIISDYMMHLLVMQPDMILPGYRKDFWFSHVSETLGDFFTKQRASSSNDGQRPFQELYGDRLKSRGASELEGNALKIAEKLKANERKWEIIEAVWSEIVCYAAIACPHVNHVRELRRGGEFVTHIWLMLTMSFLQNT